MEVAIFWNKLKCAVCVGLVAAAVISSFFPPIVDSQIKNHRFLMCVSSFKRPIFLSGMIYRLLNQSYKNYDISISVKGIKKEWAEKTFMKEWLPLTKNGNVFLRFDENRKQMNNFLDTVRDVDLEKYDYFCKIDDDDWYSPDYLEDINRWLNTVPDAAITRTYNAYILTENTDGVIMFPNNTNLCGPTLCFHRKVIKAALEIEKDPSKMQLYLPNEAWEYLLVWNEDRVLDHLGDAMGAAVVRSGGDPKVMYGQQYRSVMRNINNEYVSFEGK